ncbi:meiotically up-regulated gene 56 protein [Pleomassaria siparia CBS 279.74]|uniref:Meiotically up-regulated gene 56 protein n=1 Tax=Pleomassaria siparia CBS 279.74 TaxID=1314801 RepID=A0A6G1K759_9PLEO|nr:meiotically up-regulated gene 56 protein [Pleomassaria siparia CBS 279.74]
MPEPRAHSWHQQPDTASLSPESYTAQRLQHSTPEHLHLTSRRLFIGPIPEAWLKSNRRDWYKHHLHINYSSRTATFSSPPDPRESKQRRLTGLEGPSSSALFQHSFPQPIELPDEDGDERQDDTNGKSAMSDDVSGKLPALQIPRGSQQKGDVVLTSYEDEDSVTPPSEPDQHLRLVSSDEPEFDPAKLKKLRRSSTKSFVTASSTPEHMPRDDTSSEEQDQPSASQLSTGQEAAGQKAKGKRPISTAESSNGAPAASTVGEPSVDTASTSSLLRKADMSKTRGNHDSQTPSKGILARAKRQSQKSSDDLSQAGQLAVSRTKSNLRNLVKFDLPEDSKRASLHLKAKVAQMTVVRASSRLRRHKLKDGLVLKMERMLIRVDATAQDIPEDFDENGSQKIDSRVKDKWREYMVVCRQSISDEADFVLQMYKTRVIPEIEQSNAAKKAEFDIPLGPKITKVNMYSALDKSVVVWVPSSRGTTIFIMQARAASNAVEWYTFLRNIMGWRRASELQINIPDLSVSLQLINPFKKLEVSQDEAQDAADSDNEEAILRTMKEEQAVAENLVRRCLDQLEDSIEWTDVLDSWIKDQRIGLAWKRYDRLEWIHGANERKMYGTIAMQKSHELELRPKSHYPTTTVTQKKKKTLTEPVPVEGFLIRLTGQRGRAKRLGLMYHKRLYFSSHDQYLVFSRPNKATPPPPPKLVGPDPSAVPSARTIADSTPDTWAVNPYPLKDNHIEWLMAAHTNTAESRTLHDLDAADEAARKGQNLVDCDGYINLANIVKVRKAKMGASPVDNDLESGSDVDFDDEIDDTNREYGATKEIDIHRTFELILKNGLIIRLQAADKKRRKEWVKHLRALSKYWRNRTACDINLYKSTRSQNLNTLNIDEEAEAYIGQFARKWEVTQSFASPQLYNFCGIAGCRSIHMSGMLYRKPRIHAPFTRCSVILAAGTLLIFQDVLRGSTGQELAHIHHERTANLDLKDCYIYSGLLTESDLLYQNQTFDANKPGHHALPRIYLEDGWTSTDEDVMTTFVVWHGKSKSWFRAEEGAGGGEKSAKEGTRRRLKRVAKLGSKGRSVVFRARSRAERDHWVLAIQNEIEKVQGGKNEDFRIEESAKKVRPEVETAVTTNTANGTSSESANDSAAPATGNR